MLTFFDQKAEFYPHIYSSQMHQLKAINDTKAEKIIEILCI